MEHTYGKRSGLTDSVKHDVVNFLLNPDEQPFRIQRLMQYLTRKMGEERPPEKTVSTFVQNFRARRDEEVDVGAMARKYEWTIADFKAAVRRLPDVTTPNATMSVAHFSEGPDLQFIVTSPKILGA